ncbi:MAG TPA: hypothetical protein PLR14_01115 [Candidatus Paceibacterota bacterium]|nr:hypothetical protein [Candidatus Paceibacterota bacterium]
MKQNIFWFLGGLVLGLIILFIYNLTIPTTPKPSVVTPSPECGPVTPFRYCGSSTQLCTVNCNACGCDTPLCESLPQCVP